MCVQIRHIISLLSICCRSSYFSTSATLRLLHPRVLRHAITSKGAQTASLQTSPETQWKAELMSVGNHPITPVIGYWVHRIRKCMPQVSMASARLSCSAVSLLSSRWYRPACRYLEQLTSDIHFPLSRISEMSRTPKKKSADAPPCRKACGLHTHANPKELTAHLRHATYLL